ncbi:MAG: glycosyltransferase family 4 protein [Candidatus Hermodarchaeota archaeon]
MEIRTFIGRKLDYVNGVLRRQIELDRHLIGYDNLNLTYYYYLSPKNVIDFLSKRYFLYPYRSYREDSDKNTINHLTFQYLGDLCHFLDKSRTIITCHDIYTFLERGSIKNPYFLQLYSLLGMKKCRLIISVSDFTKSQLIERFKIPESKIVVIKNAINRKIFYPMSEEIHETLYPNSLKLLHVGTEDYRKDFPTLLKAFYLIKKQIKNVKLIRVGRPLFKFYIKKLGLEKDIVYIKNISNRRLREIYNLVDFFIFPSLYEGYGFPGLEAASCGTPVICTDIPIFREIYQDFPYYFPLRDYRALASNVINNIKDEVLRKEKIKKGFEVLDKYSWENSAKLYLKTAQRVIENI